MVCSRLRGSRCLKLTPLDENMVKPELDPARHVVVKYDYDVIEQDYVELSPAQHEHNPTLPAVQDVQDVKDCYAMPARWHSQTMLRATQHSLAAILSFVSIQLINCRRATILSA